MEKGSKKKNNIVERTLPIQNENYHGFIASSNYYKCKPTEWKYLQGGVNMRYLLANEYQRMWMDEQQQWHDRVHRPKKQSVDIVKKYVTEFKDKVHPNVPRIDTRMCQLKKSGELAKGDSTSKIQGSVEKVKKGNSKTKIMDKGTENNESNVRSIKNNLQAKPCNESGKHTPRSNRCEVEKENSDNVTHTTRSVTSNNKYDPQQRSEGSISSRSSKTISKVNVSARESCEEKCSNIDRNSNSARSVCTIKSNRSAIQQSECTLLNGNETSDGEGSHSDRSVISKRNGLTDDSRIYNKIQNKKSVIEIL